MVQYVGTQVMCSIAIGITRFYGVYGEMKGFGNWQYAYTYIFLIISASQCWALYCLVHFYEGTKEKLEPISPLFKFASIKMIVFFTFWQAAAINVLNMRGFFEPPRFDFECQFGLPVQSFSAGLQAFLICLEMFLAAVLHRYVFAYSDYVPENKRDAAASKLGFCSAVGHTFNNSDVCSALCASIWGIVGILIPEACKSDVRKMKKEGQQRQQQEASAVDEFAWGTE